MESRLQAAQQENRQLRALLHHARGSPDWRLQHLEAKTASACAAQHPCLCPAAANRLTSRLGAARGASAACTAATCFAARGGRPQASGIRSLAPQRGAQRTGKETTAAVSSSLGDSSSRRAIVDVQVRLPSASLAAAAPPSLSSETLALAAAPAAPTDSAQEPRAAPPAQMARREEEPTEPPAAPATKATRKSKASQAALDPKERRHTRTSAASALRSDESDPSSSSSSSGGTSRRGARCRNSRKARERTAGCRESRSASRGSGSVSTSTSSSSAKSHRRLGGHRGRRCSTRDASSRSRPQRISFSVPEARRTLSKTRSNDSSSGSQSPERSPRGGHRVALRGDVAGRLQASLSRLKERQMLQDQIHSLAKRLLNQHSGAQRP